MDCITSDLCRKQNLKFSIKYNLPMSVNYNKLIKHKKQYIFSEDLLNEKKISLCLIREAFSNSRASKLSQKKIIFHEEALSKPNKDTQITSPKQSKNIFCDKKNFFDSNLNKTFIINEEINKKETKLKPFNFTPKRQLDSIILRASKLFEASTFKKNYKKNKIPYITQEKIREDIAKSSFINYDGRFSNSPTTYTQSNELEQSSSIKSNFLPQYSGVSHKKVSRFLSTKLKPLSNPNNLSQKTVSLPKQPIKSCSPVIRSKFPQIEENPIKGWEKTVSMDTIFIPYS